MAWHAGPVTAERLRVALGSTTLGFSVVQTLRRVGTLPPAINRYALADPLARAAVAVSAGGDAVVAWLARARSGCGHVVRAAVLLAGRRTFERGRAVSVACGRAGYPRVALDARGVGAIAWVAGPAGPHRRAVVMARLTRGRIGAPTVVTSSAAPYAPTLAAAASGPILAWRAYARRDGGTVFGRVMAASSDARGQLRAARALSRTDRTSGTPRLAVGPDGTAAALWQTRDALDRTVFGAAQLAVRRPGSATFSAPETAPGSGGPTGSLQVATDRRGGVALLHCDGNRATFVIRAGPGAFLAPELAGLDPVIAQGGCLGPAAPSAQLAVGRTGEARAALPQYDRIVLVERPGPLG